MNAIKHIDFLKEGFRMSVSYGVIHPIWFNRFTTSWTIDHVPKNHPCLNGCYPNWRKSARFLWGLNKIFIHSPIVIFFILSWQIPHRKWLINNPTLKVPVSWGYPICNWVMSALTPNIMELFKHQQTIYPSIMVC